MSTRSQRFLTLAVYLFALSAQPSFGLAAQGESIGSFAISDYAVEGNTLLDAAAVHALLVPYTGPKRDFSDIEHAVAALEGAYRKRGFGLVKVVLPEQELNGGVVHIKIIETRLRHVSVQGNQTHSTGNVRRSLPALQEGAMPNTGALSTELHMANENPSRHEDVELSTGTQPGEINADIKVDDSRTWSAGAILDNSGFDPSGRYHVTAQYQNFNVGGWDHVFSAQYTTSIESPSKLSIYGAGYHVPLYTLHDSLDFYGSYSTIDAGSVAAGLVDLTVSGAGTVYGTHFTHEFPRWGRYESQLIFGLDRKQFRNDIYAGTLQLGGDVTVDPVSLSYTGQWALTAGTVNFYLTGVRNIPGGSQASEADFTTARSGASRDYTLWRYGVGFTRPLPQEWLLRLTFNGQLTHDALVPGEQFGAGGPDSVRGLHERAIADDQGFTANAEIYTPNLCGRLLHSAGTRCEALAFFDDGHLWRNDALPGEPTSESVRSTGIGIRLDSGKSLSVRLDYGQVVGTSDASLRDDRRLDATIAVSL